MAFDLRNTLLPLAVPELLLSGKKLDSLETNVSTVLLTIDQFVDLGNSQVGWPSILYWNFKIIIVQYNF